MAEKKRGESVLTPKQEKTLELTVVEKIWGYLLELQSLIADIFEIAMEETLNEIADDNQLIKKIIKMMAALNTA
ncbi:MAG: hypothetical protein M1445_13905 [Bacteroidetes bacterium]|nr:hypothetical protein [Bacteroidota bacterium]MCL6103029.1 hypothetical protein [Bacteroidota bacterium]